MADITASIKQTQEQLGKFVKKPPLTEKNLTRPPFRFLHDIVHNVIDSTGFMSDAFTAEELDAANVTTREAKSAFMQKFVQAVKDKTGEEIAIKISKVLAGLEADKTNGLLQSLAKAIESHQQENGGPPKKAVAAGKKAAATPAAAAKPKPGSKSDKKTTGSTKAGAVATKDGSGGTKRTIRDPSPGAGGGSGGTAGRMAAKQGKTGSGEAPGSGGAVKTKSKAMKGPAAPAITPAEQPLEQSVPESLVSDETNEKVEEVAPKKPQISRKESSADLVGGHKALTEENVDLDNNGIVGRATPSTSSGGGGGIGSGGFGNQNNSMSGGGGDDGANNNLNANDDDANGLTSYDDFAASALVKPNMQTLPPPTTPIKTDADAVIATMTPPPLVSGGDFPLALTPTHNKSMNSLTPTPGPSLTPSPSPVGIAARAGTGQQASRPPSGAPGGGSRSLSREASAEQQPGKGSPAIGEIRPPTGQQRRPDTGTSGRLSSARPPSARRAPPRPKSSVVREEAEPYRPTTGKVSHVIMDNSDDGDEDDNYVVREVTVTASKAPGLSDLDETPELGGGLGGGGFNADLDTILPADQRGLLVNQILETQKELEDKGGKGGEDTPMIDKKLKELSLAEVEKLKNLIQLCARSANPLAKLLDYMAEDVDSMQKEYNNYREESKKLSLGLENAKVETDKFLQSLKHELTDIERKIKDKEDAILASQMKIIQQEERIEEIVVGFERVRSGKTGQALKEHMPTAEEILTHIQSGMGGGVGGGGGGIGGGGVYGGGMPSNFTFSSVGPSVGSTPSSATSGVTTTGGGMEPFKIPDSFMVNPVGVGVGGGGEDMRSPFSRGRMWSSMTNNNGVGGSGNSATFDVMGSSMDEDQDDNMMMGSMGGMGTNRNKGRSGPGFGGGGGGGGFRRSATTMDGGDGGGNMADVDNFNPW